MKIACDVHVHLWDANSRDHIDESFINELRDVSGRDGTLNVDLQQFSSHFANVDSVVVFGGMARHTGLHVPNKFIHDFVQNSEFGGKLIPFVGIDPFDVNYLDEFERAVEDWGFRGVKLMPMYANFDPRDELLAPLYEACERKGLPILFHMGTTFCRCAPLNFAEPMMLEPVALKYPNLKMIVAHMGHPFENQTVVLIRKQPNVFSDLSALHYRPWQLFNSMMLAQEYGVTHKLLFGTDYPFTMPDESMVKLREIMRFSFGAGSNMPHLNPAWMEDVFARDTVSLLGLI